MRIKHQFTFSKGENSNDILNTIINNNINYVLANGIPLITFDIFEDDEAWDEVNSLMISHNIMSLKECIYSAEEYDNASWFVIRSKYRWEYPQPENQFEYKFLTYDNSNYCDKCGCGLVQKENFKVKKSPKWGKRSFLMLNWIEDELFTNYEVETVLSNYNLKGFKFIDLKNVRLNYSVDNIKQIYINNILRPGLLNQNDTILKEITCNNCGCNKIIMAGRGIIFSKGVFENIENDIVKSSEVFGDGRMCFRMIFASRNFYNAIRNSSLDKDLIFEPVILV